MKTKTVRLTCNRHTHAGREYRKGDTIIDMPAASADWLIGTGRAEPIEKAGKHSKQQQTEE